MEKERYFKNGWNQIFKPVEKKTAEMSSRTMNKWNEKNA